MSGHPPQQRKHDFRDVSKALRWKVFLSFSYSCFYIWLKIYNICGFIFLTVHLSYNKCAPLTSVAELFLSVKLPHSFAFLSDHCLDVVIPIPSVLCLTMPVFIHICIYNHTTPVQSSPIKSKKAWKAYWRASSPESRCTHCTLYGHKTHSWNVSHQISRLISVKDVKALAMNPIQRLYSYSAMLCCLM